jgi:YjjG family noncanonical pyrimidine nucleotidase
MARYSTVLIDLDHTLFDTQASEIVAFDLAMALAGVAEPAGYLEAFVRINLGLWARVELGELTPQRVRSLRFEMLVEEAGLDADAQAMSDAYVQGLGANGELYPGALDLLRYMAPRACVALLTNGLSEVQRARIERLGISDLFDAIVISAEVGAAKPHAEIFDIAFDRLGSPGKESALMVGDNLSADIGGGANYGIATCWYNPGRKAAAPDHRISHEIQALDELRAYIAVD